MLRARDALVGSLRNANRCSNSSLNNRRRALLPMSLAGLLYTAALGICNDKSADCHAWQAAGQCTANSEYMHYMCPLSCGVGTVFSSDKTPSLHAAPSVSSLGLSFCSPSFSLSLVPPSLSGSREQTCLHNCSDTEESCLECVKRILTRAPSRCSSLGPCVHCHYSLLRGARSSPVLADGRGKGSA